MKPKKAKYDEMQIVVSGHVVEVRSYERLVCSGFEGQGGRVADYESERWEENRRLTGRRARDKIKRLALCNFNEKDKFITITFRDGSVSDVTDVKECNNEFKKYIKRLRYWLKKEGRNDHDFKYITVIEFQDKNGRGAVHYHMLADFGYIPQKILMEKWKHGSVNVERLTKKNDGKDVDNVGAYLIKYMIKDTSDERLRGEKAYLVSRGLEKEKKYRCGQGYAEFLLGAIGIDQETTKKVYTNSYISEHHGNISYSEYNLKRLDN